jgi:hypothetical protein
VILIVSKKFSGGVLVASIGLRPITILPIGNSVFFAKEIDPIVPCHATGRKVFPAAFLVLQLYEGQHIRIEIAYGLFPSHDGAEIARHASTLPFQMYQRQLRVEG